MHKLAIALLLATALIGCNKKSASVSAGSGDPVEVRLLGAAGPNAINCGHVKSIAAPDTKAASDCAMQSAKDKKPFYVAYEMPGLTVGVAGDASGKLFAVQAQSPPPASGQQPAQLKPTDVTVTPCPAELRVASSGRVTCYSMGSFGATTGENPHGGSMMMPPASGNNPHGGMMMPPSGTPNPHGDSMMAPAMPSAHGSEASGSTKKNSKPASKDAQKQ